ncbi:MAG TPA: phosphatase PAP2 family protein [Methylomirabilota bacterium]|nr:phosphatase PAP2 family protein [Methylomirabilota bacterium]
MAVTPLHRAALRRVLRRGKPRLLLSGAIVSLVGYLALAVFAAQQQFFALDYGTHSWIRLVRREAWNLPMELTTHLGDAMGLVVLIGIASPILWRVNRRWAMALPVLMAGTWALQWVTKAAAGRARPNLAPWGFPSGHVLSLVVFFGLIIYLVAMASSRRRRWRVVACVTALVPVVVVAFSRLYLNKHWLSDLAGGLAIGTAYLLVAIWIVEVVLTPPDEPATDEPFS